MKTNTILPSEPKFINLRIVLSTLINVIFVLSMLYVFILFLYLNQFINVEDLIPLTLGCFLLTFVAYILVYLKQGLSYSYLWILWLCGLKKYHIETEAFYESISKENEEYEADQL